MKSANSERTAEELSEAAARFRSAVEERERTILKALALGYSQTWVAAQVGLTQPGVCRMLKRLARGEQAEDS